MKRMITVCLCYLLAVLAIPFFVSRRAEAGKKPAEYGTAWGDTVKVYNHKTDKVMFMDCFSYVVGVVAAEVSPTYDEEALKATAVAAYTYAMRKKEYTEAHPGYAEQEHKGAHVCTNYAHCKSYKSDEEQRESWGGRYDEYSGRVRECVRAVYGEMLVYEGEPALTVFFSISAGVTAACEDIWGNDVPYLRSVDSRWDEGSDGFLTTVSFSEAEVGELLKDCGVSGDPRGWMKITDRAESGYVKAVTAGEKTLTGGEVRKLFSLRSNCFEISYENGAFTFTVRGYGHGVGMSQNGSQAMAAEGYTYKEILAHYYPGTEIVTGYQPQEGA